MSFPPPNLQSENSEKDHYYGYNEFFSLFKFKMETDETLQPVTLSTNFSWENKQKISYLSYRGRKMGFCNF